MVLSGLDLVKYKINRLDFNITYACNLACKGCISLSDSTRYGVESLQNIQIQCDSWHERLQPRIIALFGGEPLMHPRIHDVIEKIKQAWPEATLRLITNGYLLKKHDPEIWFKYEPLEIQVSIHRQDHEAILTEQIKRIVECRTDWKILKFTDDGHKQLELSRKGFKIYKSKFGDFVMPYNKDLTPFNSDPKMAHSICGSPATPILYKNRLYKCPPVANLLDMKPGYVDYDGVGHNEDLSEFVNGIGKPEGVCAMCPASRSHSIDHYAEENVHVKSVS